ncbi:MAG: cyclic nucleotide-binding domain-containing protein [Candidatus Competibacteraceae bacterium]|nr:cyclic nucleotide-binding domain-containing protein [Candidatus Competibacteraceae bacterium]
MSTQEFFNRTEEHLPFSAGQVIFQQGEPGELLYIVVEGQVDIQLDDQLVETLGAGDILGEMALIEDRPRSASAIAVTDCLLVPVTRQHFLTLIQHTPLFALQVMRVLANRLRRATTHQQRYS